MPTVGISARSRAVLERLMLIIRTRDYDALGDVLHPDFVQELPQSGETIAGIENFRKTLEHMPGSEAGVVIATDPHIAGDEEHFLMTPAFNVVKIEGSPDQLTSYVKVIYPDGSPWYIVTFSSYKDGKMIKRVDFFAPAFEPPEWRADWVKQA